MLTLLFTVFFVALYFAWRWWRGRYERAAREILRPKERSRPSLRTLTARLALPTHLGRSSLHIWAAVALGIGGAVISRFWWHKTPVFGLIVGAAIPFVVTAIWRRVYTQRYRKDVKTALLFAGAVFREGGTVETWIREVVDRLEGPLR
ncbi:MAG TPA: hypothetical protein GX517_13710, partial [Alicyclobacillus sp.]|nr:hypothetical protein [Alicyclobacillus sp.]